MSITVRDLAVDVGATIRDVLLKIDNNAQGIVFLCDSDNRVKGILTDGDIRRAFLRGAVLDELASSHMIRTFVRGHLGASRDDILKLFREGITHIPLIDDQDRLVDFASVHRLCQLPVMEPYLGGNELAYVTECINTKWVSSQGRFVALFEKMFAEMHNSHALTVSNGTTALHLALVTLGIGPGDEVIVPDLTFAATINAVLHTGATPVIVDVEPTTWAICPLEMERAITQNTRAVIPVHLYGQPANMNALMAVAKRHDLLVIEDAAESLGARYHGQLTGTFGDAACFSFFGNKIVTTGEGGMVLFKNPEHLARAKMLRDHGMSKDKRYWHLEVGYNYRMTNLQAAIGVAQMENFEHILAKKIQVASGYINALSDFSWMEMPPRTPGDQSVYWLFTVLLKSDAHISRDELMNFLATNGVETRPIFYPLHEMPLYRQYLGSRQATSSKAISARGFSLPSSALVTIEDIARIKALIKAALETKHMSRYVFDTPKESTL